MSVHRENKLNTQTRKMGKLSMSYLFGLLSQLTYKKQQPMYMERAQPCLEVTAGCMIFPTALLRIQRHVSFLSTLVIDIAPLELSANHLP